VGVVICNLYGQKWDDRLDNGLTVVGTDDVELEVELLLFEVEELLELLLALVLVLVLVPVVVELVDLPIEVFDVVFVVLEGGGSLVVDLSLSSSSSSARATTAAALR